MAVSEITAFSFCTSCVTVQSCFKTVVFVIARSALCDEAIPKRSIWPDKWEIASPENGSQ
jgi:hypothetical protein